MSDQERTNAQLLAEIASLRESLADQQHQNEQLRQSKEHYYSLFRDSAVGMVIVMPDGRFTQANKAFCDFLGYSESELLEKTVLSITHPDDRETSSRAIHQTFSSGPRIHRFDKRYLHKSGQALWGEVTNTLICDAEGKPSYAIAQVVNITERKQAEESFRLSEVKYRRLHQSMMDAFVRVNMDGFILECNEAYSKMLGYELEELVKLRYTDITPEKWHSLRAEITEKQIITRGYSEIYEKEYRRKDGTIIPVEMRDVLIKNDQGQPIAMWAIVRDITERKRAEEALKKAHDELERRMAGTRLNEARLEAVLQLNHMTEASLQAITDFALEQAVALTKSRIGYLAFMNEDETVLTMHSWSKEAMAECAIADKPLSYPLETTGLWGEAARQRKPIVTNDYATPNPWKKGLPEGHIELGRHMNVPVLDKEHIVIVAGVGNKDEDYDESDVRQLTLLMEGMWGLIQRQRVQTELQRHRDHLEQLVKERTEALKQSHNELQAIYEGMVDGCVLFDTEDLEPLRVNAALCAMLGYTEDEIKALTPEQKHPTYFLPKIREHYEATLKGQRSFIENVPIFHKERHVLFFDLATTNILYNGRRCQLLFFHDITKRRLAEEALQKEHRTLKHLLQSSDHERQTIAYEIHDGLAQYLAAAVMQFDVYKHQLEKKPTDAAKAYEAAMTLLKQGHFESRRLIAGVRPPVLDEAGVVEAIAHLINEQNRTIGPQIEFTSKVKFSRLMPILENAIYRIIQEGMTNACKYSQSERVRITLLQQNDRLRIEIRDWGIGFDTSNVKEGSYGLTGIRERARLLGGKYRVQSKAGKGTRIVVELPLMEREE